MYLAPRQLRPGDRVAIVAPASPFKSDELHESIDVMREAGLRPVFGSNVKNLKSVNIYAAPLRDRIEEMMWAFTDDSIKAVFAATGGCGSAELLPYLDYEAIARSRKCLVGMSDITALNQGILARSGLISINGQSPNIRLDKGKRLRDTDTESLRMTIELMMSGEPWGTKPFDKMNQFIPRTISPGRVNGHALGANNDTFVHLLGTPFMPNIEGGILFFEDVHKNGESIARQFIHMKNAGVLDRLAGVVVGEFIDLGTLDAEEHKVPDIPDVLIEYLGKGKIPSAAGYSFSHGEYTIPIPVGAMCDFDADSGVVSFRFAMAR